MFDWLFEGSLGIYLLLGLIAAVLGYIGIRDRNQRILYSVGVVVFLIVLYFILDLLVETEPEQIKRKLAEMAKGMNKPDTAAVSQHLSQQFKFRQLDKNAMRRRADEAIKRYSIRNIRIWDVEVKDMEYEKRTAKVTFSVKADSSFGNEGFLLCRSVWVLDGDDQWRMKTFDLYNPVVGTDTPLEYPFE
jgi:hypothetical protein